MKIVVLIDEMSVFHLLWHLLKKNKLYLLRINPIIPFFRPVLTAITKFLLAVGWLRDISELDDHAADVKSRMPLFPSKNWYARSETLFIDQLKLNRQESGDDFYDYAACKQATNYGADQLQLMNFIQEMNEKAPGLHLAYLGCDPILPEIHALLEPVPSQTIFAKHRYPRRLINVVMTGLALSRALLHLVRFTKFRTVPRRKFLMAIDVIDNLSRMEPAMNDILDDAGQQGLYVFRNKNSFQNLKEGLKAYPLCPYPDGQFGVRDFAGICRVMFRDSLRLYQRFSHLDPKLFLPIVKLCGVRIYFEGFFNKYDIAYFFGRDEYNAEHIIRSQELRRRGGVSLGLVNGLNVFKMDSVFRYIDYDITYVFSPGPYLRSNGDNWRHPSGVRAIGALGLSRRELLEMSRQKKSDDIVCFAKTYCDGPAFLDEMFRIGRAFPDRNVFISLKKSSTRLGGGTEFFGYLENAPANVTLVEDGSFDLIKRCRYVLSGESSIIVEAINLKSIAFFLDTYPAEDVYVYREYPGICYRTGDEIIDRIKQLESGHWQYPLADLEDLVDLSGTAYYDTIRRDIGLEPRDREHLTATVESAPALAT